MRCASLLACLLTVAFAGCGGSDGNHAATIATIPSGTKRATAAPKQIAAGGRVVTDAGCLACQHCTDCDRCIDWRSARWRSRSLT